MNSRAISKKRKRKATPPPSDRRAGRISGVFGLQGEVKIDPTSAGRSVFVPGGVLRVTNGETSREVSVRAVREHQGRPLVLFEGFSDADASRELIGAELYAPRDAFVLDAGEYLDEDLVGCRLVDEAGTDLGSVSAVEHYPAQDLLVVGKSRVPMVRAFIREIDLAGRRITVCLPPGLID